MKPPLFLRGGQSHQHRTTLGFCGAIVQAWATPVIVLCS
jgi:hypothetical protein